MKQCDEVGCKNRASTQVADRRLCYEHYNAAIKQGLKAEKVKADR